VIDAVDAVAVEVEEAESLRVECVELRLILGGRLDMAS
jgi:hypothetical protein